MTQKFKISIGQKDVKEVEHAVYCVSGVVKVVTGVGNSAAHLVMLHAHDQIKNHPNYRHNVKKAYKDAVNEMRIYRRNLLHSEVGFFRLANLPEKERARYAKDATDADFFDYWQNPGAMAYERTKPFITSLWNKFRLSLVNHNVPHPDILAWGMTADVALRMADDMYQIVLDDCVAGYHLPEKMLHYFFDVFSVRNVWQKWRKALLLTDTAISGEYKLDPVEEANIEMGISDLRTRWLNFETILGSTIENINDYGEIFSTKGNQKRSARGMTEVLQEVKQELL